MKRIDLHVHTTASDGTTAPEDIPELACRAGLSAIAITDHDTVSGYEEACGPAAALGLEIIPGIEISTRFNGSVHILGYFIDPHSPHLLPVLNWVVQDRDERNEKIAALMRADGIDADYAAMKQRYGDVIGRPHFAELLVNVGLAQDIRDAFVRYLNKGCRYWLARHFVPIEDSLRFILRSGGVPVLAHPFQYRMDDADLRDLIEHCLDYGLMGLECRYSGYTHEQTAYLQELAREYRLIETGGSDYHGERKPDIALGSGTGDLRVPGELLDELRDTANSLTRYKEGTTP